MQNYIVAKIHNNSLGKCLSVSSENDGIETIKEWFKDQFSREMTPEEKEILENTLEITIDDDSDNIFTFSIGIVE